MIGRLATFAEISDRFPDLKLVSVRTDAPALPATAWQDAVATGGELPEANIDPDSESCIFYTSGTTGRPKGAQLTHRGCVANVMNVAAMGTIYATHRALELGEVVDAPSGCSGAHVADSNTSFPCHRQ